MISDLKAAAWAIWVAIGILVLVSLIVISLVWLVTSNEKKHFRVKHGVECVHGWNE